MSFLSDDSDGIVRKLENKIKKVIWDLHLRSMVLMFDLPWAFLLMVTPAGLEPAALSLGN